MTIGTLKFLGVRVLLLSALVGAWEIIWRTAPWHLMMDFQAFYCGTKVMLTGSNPYFTEPLRLCEAAVNPLGLSHTFAIAVPDPLPPYAILLFAPLVLLPALPAMLCWLLVLIGSMLLSVYLTSKLTTVPIAIVAAAFLPAVIFTSLVPAALAPVTIALWLTAAFALRVRRYWLAAAALGASMIQPHLALPICIAAFIAAPRVRVPLLLAGGVLLVLQTLFTPVSLIHHYIALLQLHSFAEVSNDSQFSLTFLLHNLGVSAAAAVRIGMVQYLLFAVLGITIGVIVARNWNDRALLVLVPATFAVFGGTFVHLTEIAIAIPLAFYLWHHTRSQLAALPVLLLSTPWYTIHGNDFYVPTVLLTTGTLIWYFWKPRPCVVAASVACAATFQLLAKPNSHIPDAIAKHIVYHITNLPPAPPLSYSSMSWKYYNDLFLPSTFWLQDHWATWAGLLLLLIALCIAKRYRSETTSTAAVGTSFTPR